MVLLDVRDLSVVFPGGVHALRSVSVQIRKGEMTVLLGRSGAGKSSLLRCLNRLQAPTSGSVRATDVGDIGERRALAEHRRRTGMVFQLHHLHGRQTALQNVLMGRLGYHSAFRSLFPLPDRDVRLALECLDRVGLVDKAQRRIDQLSGGERQRVGIARALVQKPRLILADEPVASLDPATAGPLLDRLRTICREDGLTAVLSLHQLDYARTFGERLLGLCDGRIVFDGPPEGLLEGDLKRIYGPAPEVSSPPPLEPGLKENRT
jgi:phosphonate transport system ATP-binding protein